MPYQRSFGLDPAGYGSGKTALAAARVREGGAFAVEILTEHPFDCRRPSSELIAPVIEDIRRILGDCLHQGPLAIDMPLDVQGLPRVSNPVYPWQLTKRPVDYAFGAMPAFADRVGAPVALFKHVLGSFPNEQSPGP